MIQKTSKSIESFPKKKRGFDQPLISEGEISFCSYDDMIQELYLEELPSLL